MRLSTSKVHKPYMRAAGASPRRGPLEKRRPSDIGRRSPSRTWAKRGALVMSFWIRPGKQSEQDSNRNSLVQRNYVR